MFLFKFVQHWLKLHYEALFINLDALKWDGTYEKSKICNQFRIALVIFCLIFLDQIFGLQYEYESSIDDLCHSPYIMLHQITPKLMWFQTDMVMLIGTVTTVAVFAILSYKSCLPSKWCIVCPVRQLRMYLQIDRKPLPLKVSMQARAFSSRAQMAVKYVSLSFELFVVYCYCYFNVFFVNSVYRVSVHSVWIWAVAFPLYFFYIIYVVLAMQLFVIMSSKYIQIRQKYSLTKLRSFNRRLALKKTNHSKLFALTIRIQYILLNREVVHICRQTAVYSKFWCSILSVIFPYYIFEQCYLAYLSIFAENIPIEQGFIYFLVLCEIVVVFCLLIRECAAVVKNNNGILSQCRHFYVRLFCLSTLDSNEKGRLNILAMLKAQEMQVFRRFHPYAFKLFNNYRITSKTFQMILFYISVAYMYIFKRKM